MDAPEPQHVPCPECNEPLDDEHRCQTAGKPSGKGKARVDAYSSTLAMGGQDSQMTPPADFMIGKILGGKYRVLESIGSGGMGVVYLVEHITLKKRFAAKVLLQDLCRHPEAIQRFEIEAKSASKLDHDNIVTVIDYGRTDEGTLYLVMEYLKGETLDARINGNLLALDEIVATIVPICHALAHAHAQGIVHRDMKPENVFLAQRGGARPVVKLLDFGISKMVELGDGRITKQGQVLGSPEYMSPEAARGDEVDARADIYAVGVMLYEMLCGTTPFRHDNYLKVLQMHANQPPQPLNEHMPDVPRELEQLVMKTLSKNADERPQTIGEFEEQLIAALPGDPEVWERVLSTRRTSGLNLSDRYTPVPTPLSSPALDPSTVEETLAADKKMRRLRWPWLGAGALLVVAIALLAWRSANSDQASNEAADEQRAQPRAPASGAALAEPHEESDTTSDKAKEPADSAPSTDVAADEVAADAAVADAPSPTPPDIARTRAKKAPTRKPAPRKKRQPAASTDLGIKESR